MGTEWSRALTRRGRSGAEGLGESLAVGQQFLSLGFRQGLVAAGKLHVLDRLLLRERADVEVRLMERSGVSRKIAQNSLAVANVAGTVWIVRVGRPILPLYRVFVGERSPYEGEAVF